jgi:hypothetical protein
MPNSTSEFILAQVVLATHLLAVVFIALGLIAIPVGVQLKWSFVQIFWWRFLHFGAITLVALQKLLGNLCFLTVWEFNLLSRAGRSLGDVQPALSWADRLIHWNLPLWFFTMLYAATWLCAAWMWWRYPPHRPGWLRRSAAHP